MQSIPAETFRGYRRKDGKVGVRNEIWVIPTVGCVNDVAKALVKENQDLVSGSVDGLYTFTHPFGCSQTGEDHAQTRKLLASLVKHPNAGAVLVLGLGCENLTQEQFLAMYGMLTGTASTGIILLREIDRDFKTPASENLVYQTLPAIVFGFPMMLLATLAPVKPALTFAILVLFFIMMNIILFRSKIFRRKKA